MRTLAIEIYKSNSFSKLPEFSFSDFLWIQPLQQAMSLLPQCFSVTIIYVYFYLITLLLPLAQCTSQTLKIGQHFCSNKNKLMLHKPIHGMPSFICLKSFTNWGHHNYLFKRDTYFLPLSLSHNRLIFLTLCMPIDLILSNYASYFMPLISQCLSVYVTLLYTYFYLVSLLLPLAQCTSQTLKICQNFCSNKNKLTLHKPIHSMPSLICLKSFTNWVMQNWVNNNYFFSRDRYISLSISQWAYFSNFMYPYWSNSFKLCLIFLNVFQFMLSYSKPISILIPYIYLSLNVPLKL
jgi:hypothetical protein